MQQTRRWDSRHTGFISRLVVDDFRLHKIYMSYRARLIDMRLHFKEQSFDYQSLRTLAYTTFGGAEPGEVLVTVERIDSGDTESWYKEWTRTAERVEAVADDGLDNSSGRTAMYAYFRAHTYYRTAEFFLPPGDPRRIPTYEKSRTTFRRGLDLLQTPTDVITIPYEDSTLPGYLFLPPDATRDDDSIPTIVCLGGLDSLAEELYFICGIPEALERGYAICLFDGPGQGAPLRTSVSPLAQTGNMSLGRS